MRATSLLEGVAVGLLHVELRGRARQVALAGQLGGARAGLGLGLGGARAGDVGAHG